MEKAAPGIFGWTKGTVHTYLNWFCCPITSTHPTNHHIALSSKRSFTHLGQNFMQYSITPALRHHAVNFAGFLRIGPADHILYLELQ
jgi:hypothetical protein